MAEIELNATSPRRLGCLLTAGAALLLGLLIVIVLSAQNRARMELKLDESGRLAVFQGSYLPWGETLYEPHRAFAPLEVPESVNAEQLELGDCEDVSECEAMFYRAVLQMAATVLEQPSPDHLETAKELIVRAQIFPSIPLSERGPIEDLTGAIHYVEAVVLLEETGGQLGEVLKRLERSRIADVPFVERERLEALIELVKKQIEVSQQIQRMMEPLEGSL